jgi:hypothetical protein
MHERPAVFVRIDNDAETTASDDLHKSLIALGGRSLSCACDVFAPGRIRPLRTSRGTSTR